MENRLSRLLSLLLVVILASGIAVACSPRTPAPGTPAPPSQSVAGLVEKLTLDDLAARADSVVLGEVADVAYNKDNKGNIYTVVTFSVEQTLKGESTSLVVISVPGGKFDGQTLEVEDAPGFQVGERSVVFLAKGDGILAVVGGFQGKFVVDRNNMVGSVPLQQFIQQVAQALGRPQ